MAKTMTVECAECGRVIDIGDEYYMSSVSGERLFCKPECLREWIKESDKLDEVVDEWIEEDAENYEMESDDPYDRYGVYRSDF